MRFAITVLFLTFTLLEAVNAAAVLNSKRDVAPDVQSCVNNINTFSIHLNALLKQIEAGTAFHGGLDYDGQFDDIMDATKSSCCGIQAVISDMDADFFLTSIANIAPKVQNVLSALTAKQDSYNFWTKFLVQGQMVSLDLYTGRLGSCFVAFNPNTKISILQGYIDQMKAAFTAARTAYNANSWISL